MHLSIMANDRIIKTVPLKKGIFTLGNDPLREIPIFYPTISHLHGRIVVDKVVTYQDLNSRNGTLLESIDCKSRRKLNADEIIELNENVRLQLGPAKIFLSTENKENLIRDAFKNFRETEVRGENPLVGLKNWVESVSVIAPHSEAEQAAQIVRDLECGGDFLEKAIENPQCKEILANSPSEIFLDFGNGLIKSDRNFPHEVAYLAWIQSIVTRAKRRLDIQNPLCEGTLPCGARIQAILAPTCHCVAAIAIRRFGSAPITLDQALQSSWLEMPALEIIKEAIEQKKNIVIAGGTSSGKTSLLNLLCGLIPTSERIITIEDTKELSLSNANFLQLQARRANAEGIGAISIRVLLQTALRMRPDRIIVGEVRSDEVIDLLQAFNTGHPGSFTTVHANSPEQALLRLELLALMSAPNLNAAVTRQWLKSCIDIIIYLKRSDNLRHVESISVMKNGNLTSVYRRQMV